MTVIAATRPVALLIERILVLDDQISAASKARGDLAVKLQDRLEPGVSVESVLAVVSNVQGHSTQFDYDKAVELHPAWMRKVTKAVFDQGKFTLLRKAGEVPDEVLALAVEVETRPYLKITRKP